MRFALLLPILVACGESSFSGSTDATPGSTASDATTEAPSVDTASSTEPQVRYYGIEGALQLVEGVPEAATSALELAFWSDVAAGAPDCVESRVVELAQEVPADDPDVPLIHFWELQLAEATPPCGEAAAPLRLGLGAYDPRLDPALQGHEWSADQVYGLYVQESAEAPLYVIGVATTAALDAGSVPVETSAPLPDDLYELHTLVLLSL